MVAAKHITAGSRSAQSKSGRVAVERGAQPKHSAPCKAGAISMNKEFWELINLGKDANECLNK